MRRRTTHKWPDDRWILSETSSFHSCIVFWSIAPTLRHHNWFKKIQNKNKQINIVVASSPYLLIHVVKTKGQSRNDTYSLYIVDMTSKTHLIKIYRNLPSSAPSRISFYPVIPAPPAPQLSCFELLTADRVNVETTMCGFDRSTSNRILLVHV